VRTIGCSLEAAASRANLLHVKDTRGNQPKVWADDCGARSHLRLVSSGQGVFAADESSSDHHAKVLAQI